ncbi:MAG: hypothetical protein ACQESR_07945 [Planctomycetota bacterium]
MKTHRDGFLLAYGCQPIHDCPLSQDGPERLFHATYISGGWILPGGKLPDASRPPVGRTRGGESHPRPVYYCPRGNG